MVVVFAAKGWDGMQWDSVAAEEAFIMGCSTDGTNGGNITKRDSKMG